MRLKGQVVVVTGSAQGLGKEIALQFSREGARVVVCDILDCRETAQEIQAISGEVLSLKTDVTSAESTLDMAKKTFEHFGKIDILINNASIFGGLILKSFYEVADDEWDKIMAVNVKGVFLCCKAVFPFMKEQGKGKIVNISSIVPFQGTPNFIHYTTSKGAVIAFTRAMANELGRYSININSVAPGNTMTKAGMEVIPKEFREMIVARRALKRLEQPEDVLGAVMFLSSEESDFITGQTIVVDGGTTMH